MQHIVSARGDRVGDGPGQSHHRGRALLVAGVAAAGGRPGHATVGWPGRGRWGRWPALLDLVDGWVARRTGTASPFGARFDLETDAALILVLSWLVWRTA